MNATNLDPAGLAAALARAAAGLYAQEAAVRLLVEHGDWPARLAHSGLVGLDDDADRDPDGDRYAQVDWQAAVAALSAGDLPGSGSAARVLRVAASLGGGVPVDLADAVTGLDRTNLTLVLAALSHANGSHEQKEYLLQRPSAGGPPVVTGATPVLELGPVLGWPS